MTMDPFVGGLCIGMLGVALTILAASWIARRMADDYEERLKAREKRIYCLMEKIDQMEKDRNRKNTLEQIKKPLR